MNRLTDTQKVQIRELKKEGLGYRRIAKVLDILPDTVKAFLKRHPCDNNNYCLCCGKPIVQTDKRKRKFCSQKCKDKYWSKKTTHDPKYLEKRICNECGRSFFAHPSRMRIYCSRECFQMCESKKWCEIRKDNNS